MKIGFELEAFCIGPGEVPTLVPSSLPMDECGWLVEVRSEPHKNVTKAVFLLQAEVSLVETEAKKVNLALRYEPLLEIPRELKVQAARRHGKGLLSYQNIYGFKTHRNSTKLATASLHISFTNEREFNYIELVAGNIATKIDRKFKYPGFVDHAKLIVGLDRAFKEEIRVAKRNPGFYEVKGDGRIEYRSLPNNVNMNKVTQVLQDLLE